MRASALAADIAQIAPWVEAAGPAPPGWEGRLREFLELLLERNESVNLISRRTAARVVPAQVLPSLAALLVVPPGEPWRVLDVGTGGGFPGLPLKILRPEVELDLVDGTRKKCDFLEEAVRVLELEATHVHWGRIEVPPDSLRSRAPFERAFARAVGSEERIERAVRPWLAPGGSFWTFVAPGNPSDLAWPPAAPMTALHRKIGPGTTPPARRREGFP